VQADVQNTSGRVEVDPPDNVAVVVAGSAAATHVSPSTGEAGVPIPGSSVSLVAGGSSVQVGSLQVSAAPESSASRISAIWGLGRIAGVVRNASEAFLDLAHAAAQAVLSLGAKVLLAPSSGSTAVSLVARVLRRVLSQIAGSSELIVALRRVAVLAPVVVGATSVSATALARYTVVSSSPGSTTVTCSLTASRTLQFSAQGQTSVLPAFRSSDRLVAGVSGTSQTTASLVASSQATLLISGSSSSIATLYRRASLVSGYMATDGGDLIVGSDGPPLVAGDMVFDGSTAISVGLVSEYPDFGVSVGGSTAISGSLVSTVPLVVYSINGTDVTVGGTRFVFLQDGFLSIYGYGLLGDSDNDFLVQSSDLLFIGRTSVAANLSGTVRFAASVAGSTVVAVQAGGAALRPQVFGSTLVGAALAAVVRPDLDSAGASAIGASLVRAVTLSALSDLVTNTGDLIVDQSGSGLEEYSDQIQQTGQTQATVSLRVRTELFCAQVGGTSMSVIPFIGFGEAPSIAGATAVSIAVAVRTSLPFPSAGSTSVSASFEESTALQVPVAGSTVLAFALRSQDRITATHAGICGTAASISARCDAPTQVSGQSGVYAAIQSQVRAQGSAAGATQLSAVLFRGRAVGPVSSAGTSLVSASSAVSLTLRTSELVTSGGDPLVTSGGDILVGDDMIFAGATAITVTMASPRLLVAPSGSTAVSATVLASVPISFQSLGSTALYSPFDRRILLDAPLELVTSENDAIVDSSGLVLVAGTGPVSTLGATTVVVSSISTSARLTVSSAGACAVSPLLFDLRRSALSTLGATVVAGATVSQARASSASAGSTAVSGAIISSARASVAVSGSTSVLNALAAVSRTSAAVSGASDVAFAAAAQSRTSFASSGSTAVFGSASATAPVSSASVGITSVLASVPRLISLQSGLLATSGGDPFALENGDFLVGDGLVIAGSTAVTGSIVAASRVSAAQAGSTVSQFTAIAAVRTSGQTFGSTVSTFGILVQSGSGVEVVGGTVVGVSTRVSTTLAIAIQGGSVFAPGVRASMPAALPSSGSTANSASLTSVRRPTISVSGSTAITAPVSRVLEISSGVLAISGGDTLVDSDASALVADFGVFSGTTAVNAPLTVTSVVDPKALTLDNGDPLVDSAGSTLVSS